MKTINWVAFIGMFGLLTFPNSFFAQDVSSDKVVVSIFGGAGISNAYGDYPSEYDASLDFSFHPGGRVQINEVGIKPLHLAFDIGFLEVAYNGFVGPTDTYFYSYYNFLAFNFMAGLSAGPAYLNGGFYFAKALEAGSYREYTDEWITFDHQNDFGLVVEAGRSLGKYFYIGTQGRFGFKSIAEKVDIKMWALHGKLGINIFRF
jgi:hypothetical protein